MTPKGWAVGAWIRPGVLALLLVPFLAYAGYSVSDRWYRSYVLGQEEARLRREVAGLRLDNLRLQAELTEARGDVQIESVAREQLNLVKPGDRPYVLIGPASASPEPARDREPPPPPRARPAQSGPADPSPRR